MARESGRAVVMPYLHEPGSGDVIAPSGKIEEAAVAVAADAFFVVSSRVRAEQDAPGLQGFGEFRSDRCNPKIREAT